jgi:hypothetical protein
VRLSPLTETSGEQDSADVTTGNPEKGDQKCASSGWRNGVRADDGKERTAEHGDADRGAHLQRGIDNAAEQIGVARLRWPASGSAWQAHAEPDDGHRQPQQRRGGLSWRLIFLINVPIGVGHQQLARSECRAG